MIITNLNLDTLEEKSVNLGDVEFDNNTMVEHLVFNNWANPLYINWDKHSYSKNIKEILCQ